MDEDSNERRVAEIIDMLPSVISEHKMNYDSLVEIEEPVDGGYVVDAEDEEDEDDNEEKKDEDLYDDIERIDKEWRQQIMGGEDSMWDDYGGFESTLGRVDEVDNMDAWIADAGEDMPII